MKIVLCTVGAKAGAVTAACLLACAIGIPVILSITFSPISAGWSLIVFFFSIPWILAAALFGAAAGHLAARASDAVSSALVGATFSVPMSLAYSIMFVTIAEEQEVRTSIRLLLSCGSIGAVTGWVAWRAENFPLDLAKSVAFQISLTELAMLIAAIAAFLGAYTI